MSNYRKFGSLASVCPNLAAFYALPCRQMLPQNNTGMGSKKSKLCAYACLTMPVAFYAQFIFGQYDIIMTFCVLLGVYYYLKKKDIWFIFWFAIAMTFKYSALLIFAPLLLYREKNVWKIIASCVLLMVPFVLEFFVYRNSPVFQAYVFGFGGNAVSSPTGYIMNAGYYTGFELSTFHYDVCHGLQCPSKSKDQDRRYHCLESVRNTRHTVSEIHNTTYQI